MRCTFSVCLLGLCMLIAPPSWAFLARLGSGIKASSTLTTRRQAPMYAIFKNLLGGEDPQTLVRSIGESAVSIIRVSHADIGMEEFRAGKVESSIELFDRALELEPSLLPFLWQRGLSYYYAERYQEGAKQFRDDVAVNPNDTEESIWAFLCEARLPELGFEKARAQLLEVGRDPRPYMRQAYELFAGRAKEDDLLETGKAGAGPYFYSQLYLGLYAEAKGDEATARKHIVEACNAPYGRSNDYMWSLAKVHKERRGW